MTAFDEYFTKLHSDKPYLTINAVESPYKCDLPHKIVKGFQTQHP